MFKRLVGLTLVASVVALSATDPASARTLRYNDHDPPGGMRTNFVKDVWLPAIEQHSGGELRIQDFWGGALMGSREVPKGIGDGVVDMGFVFPGHYPGQLVAHSIFPLFPRGPEKFSDMVRLYRAAYEEIPELSAELERAGVKTLMFTAGLPGAFAGKKPLHELSDIAGDKWRAGSRWLLQYLGNAGAVPVSVPWDDVYVALQTGTIDGVFTNYDGIRMKKFDEVASNLLVSKELWFATPFIHLINLATWNALSEATREAILEASRIAEAEFDAVYDAAFDEVKATQLAAGYRVSEISAEDLDRWENAEALAGLQAEWVEEAEKAGLATAADVMAKMREIHRRFMEE